jgi:hypothetical protein
MKHGTRQERTSVCLISVRVPSTCSSTSCSTNNGTTPSAANPAHAATCQIQPTATHPPAQVTAMTYTGTRVLLGGMHVSDASTTSAVCLHLPFARAHSMPCTAQLNKPLPPPPAMLECATLTHHHSCPGPASYCGWCKNSSNLQAHNVQHLPWHRPTQCLSPPRAAWTLACCCPART